METERAEEREVLESIYDGDANFSQLEENLFRYKFEEFGENKNFIVEIRWGDDYPEVAPTINMDIFYNKHIRDEVKASLVASVNEQAAELLGMSMTFSLIEWLKDNSAPLLAKQEEQQMPAVTEVAERMNDLNIGSGATESTKTAKKKDGGLTKNQKRRLWDRQNAAGERDRGWDWVEIIKHLSQTKNT